MLARLDRYHFFESDKIRGKRPLMLEVGAFSGELAFVFLEYYPKGSVLIFEAEAENFAALHKATSPDNRIAVFHKAVTDRDGETALYKYPDPNSNSVYARHNFDGKELMETQVVESVCLETILKDTGIAFVDFLLLNCEGSELAILNTVGESVELQEKIGQICVSFHHLHTKMYSQEEFEKIRKKLRRRYNVIEGNRRWGYYLFY